MKYLIVLFFLTSFLPQNSHSSSMVDTSAFIGTWKGYYVCAQGKTGLNLEISAETNKIKAIFNFYPQSGNPQAPSGSFSLAGEANADGTFILKPEHWIEQPPGYGMVGMSGKIKESLIVLDGKIDASGCGSFQLEKGGPSDNSAQVKIDSVNDFDDIVLNFRTGEISSFIKYDGTISYRKEHISYQIWFDFLVPHDKVLFPRLTDYPKNSIPFSSLSSADIDKLNFEDEFIVNNWRKFHSGHSIDFNKIMGFKDTFKSLKDKNKLLIYSEKDKLIAELKQSLIEYNLENRRYIASTFLMYPITLPSILNISDYNVDKGLLKINLITNNNSLSNKHIELYGDFDLDITLEEALFLFDDRESVRCYVNFYINPLNEFDRKQGFSISYVVFRFVDDKNNILSDVVLHNFIINSNRNSKAYNKYEWSKKVFSYEKNKLQFIDKYEYNNLDLNDLIIGKWKTEDNTFYHYYEDKTFYATSNRGDARGTWSISGGHLKLKFQGSEEQFNYKILEFDGTFYRLSDNEKIYTSTKSITSGLKDKILGQWRAPRYYTGFEPHGYVFFENGNFSSTSPGSTNKGKWDVRKNKLHIIFDSKVYGEEIYNVDFFDGREIHVSNKKTSLIYLRK